MSAAGAEIGAFRAYPPNHNAPAGETPDGKVIPEEAKRVERWGACVARRADATIPGPAAEAHRVCRCWGRYYELTVEYFISEQAKIIIDVLNNSFLWTRTLGSTPMLEVPSCAGPFGDACGEGPFAATAPSRRPSPRGGPRRRTATTLRAGRDAAARRRAHRDGDGEARNGQRRARPPPCWEFGNLVAARTVQTES
jgi:hypothetical protein